MPLSLFALLPQQGKSDEKMMANCAYIIRGPGTNLVPINPRRGIDHAALPHLSARSQTDTYASTTLHLVTLLTPFCQQILWT